LLLCLPFVNKADHVSIGVVKL